MRAPRSLLILALAASLLAACGGDGESTGASEPAASPTETVVPVDEWAAGVCTALGDYTETVQERSTSFVPDTADLASLKQSWIDFLDGMVTDTQALITEIQALGKPDIADSDSAQALTDSLESVRSSMQGIRDAADGLDDSNPIAFLEEFQAALEEFQASATDATSALQELPAEISAAIEDQPDCAAL